MTVAVDGSTSKVTAPSRTTAAKSPGTSPVSVTLSPKLRRIPAKKSRAAHFIRSILDFGAPRDGVSDATEAIQTAIDACADAGGGTVFVPAGEYRTGAIWLRSHITLHLDSGATLRGS